jgi:hypothetical protein
MKNRKRRFIMALLLATLTMVLVLGGNRALLAQEEGFYLPELQPSLSTDGLTITNAVPPLVVVVDRNPRMRGIMVPGPKAADAVAVREAASSTFRFTFLAAGAQDLTGKTCQTFPENAKAAFNAAAAIWANTIKSAVPITIKACWADLQSDKILGYSGGAPQHRDFIGAPKTGTWYQASLANSLAGRDLSSTEFDMHITYNSRFSWYYGADGKPPAGQYDMVTVAAHEIAHGLNFSGTLQYTQGSASFGYNTGYPNVYDTFMKSGTGKALTSYTNPSTELGALVTSNGLWFDGPNAKAANGNSRVKMYAPSEWAPGSSYSHLDYNTFKGTTNGMMVYAVAPGSSNHNPGTVTKGLLKDLGWQMATTTITAPAPLAPSGTITDTTPTFKWTKANSATQYRFQLVQGTTVKYSKTVPASACGTTSCTNTPTTVLGLAAYKWRVQAMVANVWKPYSAYKTFTISKPVPTAIAPTGTITVTTPTYEWTKVTGATQYRLKLLQNTTTVYTKTVPSTACPTTKCTATPEDSLADATYKWSVQAYTGGVWSSYSAAKTFTVEGTPADCNAVLLPAYYNGCTSRLVTPTNCEEIDLTNGKYYEFAWTTDGVYCETPWTVCIAGNPADLNTGDNIVCGRFSENVAQGITHYGGLISLNAADFNSLGLTSNNGIYHWVVGSWYGSHPDSQTFRVKQ